MENNTSYLTKFLPNSITILALCCGLTSIRFSMSNDWSFAILLIILAGIFDFFDGWFASKIKGTSNIGAGLDSLSDVISFGVAPGLLIYLWTLSDLESLGWGSCLFFVVCSALRLARFTADIYLAPKKIDTKKYFTGIPSPAAAGLCLLPIFIYIEFDISIFQNPYLNLCNLTLISFLMISKIPTVSLKSFELNKKYTALIILSIVITCIGLLSNLWITLIVITLIYIISVLYTIIINLKIKH